MLKSKKKGLFIDISEFSILTVRTSGYEAPIFIEEIANFPLENDYSLKDIRAFLGRQVEIKGGNYPATCGIYPTDRFVCYHEAESGVRLKNQSVLKKLLQSELDINPETNNISILNAHDGSQFDPTRNASNKLIFCGAPTVELQEAQDQILSLGLLPERMEITSVATLGGFCNYMQLNDLKFSVMFVELVSDRMHIFIINKGKVDMIRSLEFGLDSLFPILQEELGLKDESSARKLFHSNTFDVAEMGRKLLKKVLKELQAVSGHYEVETGLSINKFYLSMLPTKLSWIPDTISNALGIDPVTIELVPWLQSLGIEMDDSLDLSVLGPRWLGIFSLIAEFSSREENAL